jgi:hypothetical protein
MGVRPIGAAIGEIGLSMNRAKQCGDKVIRLIQGHSALSRPYYLALGYGLFL